LNISTDVRDEIQVAVINTGFKVLIDSQPTKD